MLHGFIGAQELLEFTVIGDTVNRVARFADGAERGAILVSPELHACIGAEFACEPTRIPTKHEGEFEAYRVV